jgi:hypothetical protein
MKYRPIDLSGVKTYPISERNNKVSLKKHFSAGINAGMTVSELFAAMPDQLASHDIVRVIDAVVQARAKDKPVVIAMGAHVIKCGLQPVLKNLIEAGAVTAFAVNGAVAVHDYEISLIGETSEDVGAVLHYGRFGMAEETGRDINLALKTRITVSLPPVSDTIFPLPCMSRSAPISSTSIRKRTGPLSDRPHIPISGFLHRWSPNSATAVFTLTSEAPYCFPRSSSRHYQ